MRLVFLRHAESVGNAGNVYNMEFSGALTPRGLAQADALARELIRELGSSVFDAIVVSPLERTVRTLLPFLRMSGRQAEAWGELVEMRGRKDVDAPVPPEFRYGERVAVPPEAAEFLRLRSDEAGCRMPPANETYQEGQRRMALAAARLMELYGGRDANVLMVGHACSGARLLESLMRIELDGRFQHANTGMTIVEQKANGDFIMLCMNRVLAGPDLVVPPGLVRQKLPSP
jgi:broad specificity phosphatase PhoE